jgi:ElaB/YqjD/DUF883 family membrane-anchored ribosome-binding protein
MAINIPIITTFSDAGIGAAEKVFKKFGKTGALVGAAVTAAFGAAAVGITKALQAAAEDQKSVALLDKQLRNSVGATKAMVGATEDFIGKMQFASGVADSQLRPSLATLVRATGDLTQAQDLLGLALDLSAGANVDLETASLALSKAQNGQLGALTKLGIALDPAIIKSKDFAAAQRELEKQFGGASAAAAQTFEGQLRRLGVVFDEVTESIGYAILNNRYFKDAIDKLPGAAQAAVDAFGKGGIAGAFDAFVKNMGITGLYIQKFTLAAELAFARMKLQIENAIVGLTLGFSRFIGITGDMGETLGELGLTQVQELELKFGSLLRQIDEVTAAMRADEAAAARLAGQAELLKPTVDGVTTAFEGLGTGAGGASKKVNELYDTIKNKLTDALDDAKNQLTDAQSAFADFGKNVSDSISDAFSFSDAKEAGDETGAGFLAGLQDQVAGVKQYANNVDVLLNRGLSLDALQAVLDAGGQAGAAIAAELVAGGQEAITGPNGVNALVATVQDVADKLGLDSASRFYQAGVDQGTALVAGLESVLAKYEKILKNPNLSTKRLNALLEQAQMDIAFTQITAGQAVATPAPTTSSLQSIAEAKAARAGSAPITVNVNGGMATSAEIGRVVADSLKAFTRQNGPLEVPVVGYR